MKLKEIKYFRPDGKNIRPSGICYYNAGIYKSIKKNVAALNHTEDNSILIVFPNNISTTKSKEYLNNVDILTINNFHGKYSIRDYMYDEESTLIEIANKLDTKLSDFINIIKKELKNIPLLFSYRDKIFVLE